MFFHLSLIRVIQILYSIYALKKIQQFPGYKELNYFFFMSALRLLKSYFQIWIYFFQRLKVINILGSRVVPT
ncbi:MAG TPA: hypothetical protein DIT95_23040 [Arenibacter sp.]|nr:hypothetical protein [Arenibacter sp.]